MPPPFALIDFPPRPPRFLPSFSGCCEPRPWPPRTGFFVSGLFCCAWPNESAPARGRQQLGPTALIVIRRALKITTGQTYCLDWTSTRIATATIATAMNIQYWIRTPKMSKPSTRTCMAIAPFAGRDFHNMFIASKPSRLHPPTLQNCVGRRAALSSRSLWQIFFDESCVPSRSRDQYKATACLPAVAPTSSILKSCGWN